MDILITDRVHPMLIEGLRQDGHHVDYQPDISLAECRAIIGRYEGAVISTKIRGDASFLAAATRLHWIARLGSGLDIIDLDAAYRAGISVMSAPEGNCNAVGEHVLGMLLSHYNKLSQADQAVRSLEWVREEYRGRELSGKTIGIVGFGHTGSAFAGVLRGFNVQILSYDPYKSVMWDGVEQVEELAEIAHRADVISFHVPLTEETKYMADAGFFALCRRQPLIVNSSRGKVLRLSALLVALESGQVSGACLDVFENEHPGTFDHLERKTFEALTRDDRVLLSPHVAGWTTESFRKISEVILARIRAWKDRENKGSA